MLNKFNAIESAIVSFLNSDAEISALVNKVHEKIIDDVSTYSVHELPAIAVHSMGYTPDGEIDRFPRVNVYIEIVHTGATLATVDSTVKQIASLVIDKLRSESPRNGGNGFSDVADDVAIGNFSIFAAPDNAQYRVIAAGQVDVGIVERFVYA